MTFRDSLLSFPVFRECRGAFLAQPAFVFLFLGINSLMPTATAVMNQCVIPITPGEPRWMQSATQLTT